MTDTHTHIYLPEFDEDRDAMIQRAKDAGVEHLYLPNIDSSSIDPMMKSCKDYPGYCSPMMGLHPGSVKENYKDELAVIENWLQKVKFCAVGETGLDLYWDKTFIEQQKIVFTRQIELALHYRLPIVIHVRNAFEDTFKVLMQFPTLPTGVFHCFSGNIEQAKKAVDLGFLLGIGGVVTFNNSGLQKVVQAVGMNHLVLETDAPFLAPVPFRGKRNEPAYLKYVVDKIAELLIISAEEVIKGTTENTGKVFASSH